MKEYEKDEYDELSEYSYEDIHLALYHVEPEFAEIDVSTYPDGSVINHLYPDDLRELARMLEDAADELEND